MFNFYEGSLKVQEAAVCAAAPLWQRDVTCLILETTNQNELLIIYK